MIRKLILLLSFVCLTASAQDTPNARQAKRIFMTAYNHFYGQEGVRFSYKINLLHLYKEEGTACYKGNKSWSQHKNTIIWDNGDIKHIVRPTKKIVEIHDPKVNKKDEKLQKFKFYPDDFTYSIQENPEGFLVTLKAKPGAKGSMKQIQAVLTKCDYYPKQLRIKVTIFWATITFSDFQAGHINDNIFVFPEKKYADYKIIDER